MLYSCARGPPRPSPNSQERGKRQQGVSDHTGQESHLLAASCTIPKEPAPSTLTVSYLGFPAKGLKFAYWFCWVPLVVISTQPTEHGYQQPLLERA